MKSFFQRFHDSQPATSKSSRTKDAAYKQRISSSRPEKQRSSPPNGTEHPTEHHTTHTTSPRPSDEADFHGHAATDYSTRYSTFPGSSTTRHLLQNPSRSRTYPLDSSTNEQKGFPQNDATGPTAGRNEPPKLSSRDGHIAPRVKTERPSQSHPLSPLPPTQQHQVWLPESQVEPKEKRRQRERQRYLSEDASALRPQPKADSPGSQDDGTRRQFLNERGIEANNHRRSDQKGKELSPKEHHREQAKESQQLEQQDVQQLRERENRKKERLKLRREKEDADEREKARAKEKLIQDRARVQQGTSEKGEAKERTRRDEWDRAKEDDRMIREDRHQRRELLKEKEARERQIQLEQKDINERRDREREAKDERDRERRAKDERERERRERKARERQVERERLAAREQAEKEYLEKYERERQERQKQRERDQQEKRDREQAELERRESEFLQRDRIPQKQLQPRKDQEIRQRESKPREIDMLRVDRERQERRKKDRQLWEQQREREREERERRLRSEQARQIPEPKISETVVDKSSMRSKKRVREGVSDSEREQWHAHASDRLASRAPTQVNEFTETEDGRAVPNAEPPRLLDCVDEASEPQPFSKSASRSDEYTLKKLQSQPRPPGRSLSIPDTSPVTALPSKQAIQPPASSPNTPNYDPLGFLISHNDTPPIERSGSTAPIKSTSHPISYTVVRVPGPESSKPIPEVAAPPVARRRTASNSQDLSTTLPSYSMPSAQAQVPYPGPIPSRPGLFSSAALEGTPQDIKVLPPETPSAPQTGVLSVPEGSPNSFQEIGSAARGITPAVTSAVTTHLKTRGNQESPTQQNVIAHSSQTAQLGSSVDRTTPLPPIPNHPVTTSTGFLAVPSLHHPVKYSGMKDDMILQNKENPPDGSPRQKDSVSQTTPLQPVLPAPVSKPATAKRQSIPVPGQHEPPQDFTPPGDSFRTTHITRESSGHAYNKMQDETRLNNTFLQPTTVPPIGENPLQVSTTPVEPQYSGDKPADRTNKHQRPTQEPAPPTVTRYQGSAHDKSYHAENHFTPSVPNDSRGAGHSRHHRYASENDANRRGGKPSRYPSEGLSTSHFQQVQEPKQRINPPFAKPNNKEGDEKIAFRLPVDAPAISTGPPDGKSQNMVSEPQITIGPTLQTQQGHHVTMPSSVPSAGYMTSAAQLGSAIVRPGTTVPRSSATQTSDDPLPHLRAVVPPIGYSQSQSASRPPIDRPSTAIGIRQSVSTTSQSVARGTQPVTSKMGSNNKAESVSFPDKPAPSVRLALTETTSQETPNEYTRSRTNSETVLIPNISHSNEPHNRSRADVPAQQAPHPAKEVSLKTVPQTNMTELHNKPMLPTTSPAVEIIQPIGASYPERTTEAYDGRPMTHSNTIGKAGGTSQQQSGFPQLYSEPVARKDDTRGPPVIHPVQSRQRKQSSPRLQPEGNLLKVSSQKGPSIEDQSLTTHKTGQIHSTRRVEPMRDDQSLLPVPRYPTEMDASLLVQRPQADDRGRGKYSTGGHSPKTPQHTPPASGEPAPTLPHYPENSRIEEGRPSRSQRNHVHVKDPRLAELLSPPKAIDVPGQLYLHDARRNLASKLEQQQLDGSPNSASGNPLGNVESDTRMRTSSNRDDHTFRHVGGDSSPSISSKASQSPDLRTRDHVYARTSPNSSQHNPSPRSKPVVVESQPQPGNHNRDEMSQYATRTPTLRQPLRERQDHIPEVEDKYSRTHYQTSFYATNDAGIRSSDSNQKSHRAQNRIPYQMQDPRAGKATSQRDGQRGDARDAAQPMATTHSRSQSDSQIALDNTASHSRHATNALPYAVPPSQPHASSSSDHVRPSAPTVETLLRPPDQSPHSHSHQPDQPRVPREEATVSQQTIQPPAIKSTPSKRDATEPSPQEANPSSSLQPPTPQSYNIWVPPAPSREHRTSQRSTVTRTPHKDSGRKQERTRRPTTAPRTREPSASESHPSMDPRFAKAYHYLKTRKVHTMSLVSIEAQDGAASTIIGSPTTSIVSQMPINIPPEQDPILAAREWTEAGAILPGERVRKPGLVWADPEDPPLNYQQSHRPRSSLRRRTRSSGSHSREASDTDQPLPS